MKKFFSMNPDDCIECLIRKPDSLSWFVLIFSFCVVVLCFVIFGVCDIPFLFSFMFFSASFEFGLIFYIVFRYYRLLKLADQADSEV